MKKYIKALLATIFVVFILSTNIYAAENEVKVTKVPYSKEYEEWLNLPEDIRKNSIAPAMYDVDESVIENLRKNSSNTNTRSLLRNSALPSYYNTLDEMEIKVKNQYSRGLCWDFAFTSAAEIACKKYENETYEFSPLHIDYGTITRFKDRINPYAQLREYSTGGDINNLQGYLSSGQGPILEEYMPYDEYKGEINYSDMPNRLPSKFIDLQEIIAINKLKKMEICSGTREYTSDELLLRESIKRKIIQSGGLWAVTYMGNYTKNQNTVVYNETNQIATEGPDYKTATHAIVLIGYDDNYSADNFGNEILPKPKHDGAYIALNSWGEEWGDNGIFYISYDDVWVESDLGYIKNTSDVDYDNIYQHNYGNSKMFYTFDRSNSDENELFTANIFDRDISKREKLTKIYLPSSNYFNVQNVDIEVYVNPDNSSLNLNDLIKAECNVSNLNEGEYYINLNTPIELTGEKYAVVIKYKPQNEQSSVGIFVQNSIFPSYSDAEPINENQSFYSLNGEDWNDLYNGFNYYSTSQLNTRGAGGGDVQVNPHYAIVLKAITKSIDKDIEIIDINAKNSDVIYSDVKNEISAYVTTTANLNGEKLNVKILKDNTDVTNKFDIISLPNVKSRASDIKFKNNEFLDAGTYVLQVYTQDGLMAEKEFVVTGLLENSEDIVKFEYEDENFLNELYNNLKGFRDYSYVSLFDNQIYVKKDFAKRVGYILNIGKEDASKKITSLKGIEIFSNLYSFHIENAHLSNLDEIYKLNKLESLYIYNSSLGVNSINLKNMSDMFELYLVNCELNDDFKINVRDGLTTICLDKNHFSKIPKELYENVRFFYVSEQTITDEMEFEQNDSYVLIDLPEILKTAPVSYLTFENCEYDEASGKIRINTTNLGQGEALIEMPKVDDDYIVADPYYSFGSKYTVKYNVVEKKNIDDTDNNEDNEDENIDEPGNVIEKQEDKIDSVTDDINPKTGNNVVTISSLILLSSLIFVISLKLKKENNDNV